jgi:hypothetical protein
MSGYTTDQGLKSYFRIYPDSKSQLIHFAPATENESGFRALILRDTLTESGELKLMDPFAIDRPIIEKCLGKECWSTEPLVFIQTCPPGSLLEDYCSSQPRFVLSCSGYLEWLKYMGSSQVKVYNNMVQFFQKTRGPETTALVPSLHMYGFGNIDSGQELDNKTRCTIEVRFEWKNGEPSPKMTLLMRGEHSEMQKPIEIPFQAYSHLQSGVKRLREELRYYKREPPVKKSRQSANGSRT